MTVKNPLIRTFNFVGYEDYYERGMPEIEKLLDQYMKDPAAHYLIAVSEAVCNAAKYAIVGEEFVQIYLRIMITDCDITTTVSADTMPWDPIKYRENMCMLADDAVIAPMQWGDYTGNTARSRGFWLMLMACDYVYIDAAGKTVSLCARCPYDDRHTTKIVKTLVQRLFIERDGVIF